MLTPIAKEHISASSHLVPSAAARSSVSCFQHLENEAIHLSHWVISAYINTSPFLLGNFRFLQTDLIAMWFYIEILSPNVRSQALYFISFGGCLMEYMQSFQTTCSKTLLIVTVSIQICEKVKYWEKQGHHSGLNLHSINSGWAINSSLPYIPQLQFHHPSLSAMFIGPRGIIAHWHLVVHRCPFLHRSIKLTINILLPQEI